MWRGVLVYRDASRTIDPRSELTRLRADLDNGRASADALVSLLIDVAEFESAIADALCPDHDFLDATQRQLRRATLEVARLWLGSVGGRETNPAGVAQLLDPVDAAALPRTASRRVSEGYAYYAVFPDTYAASARRFAAAARPERVCVIGVRSIGCSLSAVVAVALEEAGCEIATLTVRPRGHPFDRELRLAGDVTSVLRDAAAAGSFFAVVDEGPGLSGSSFAAVMTALERLGVPANRIVLFPSWNADPAALRSATARRLWSDCTKYWTEAAELGITPERLFGVASATHDWSAGGWREDAFGPDDRRWPGVQPQHERWKTYAPAEGRIFRFAGLGHYGAAARHRAERLHDLRLAPAPGELRSGFLEMPFSQGTPLDANASADDSESIGRYIGSLAREFPTDRAVDPEPLLRMFETNVRELTGDCPPALLGSLRSEAQRLGGTAAVEIDGRILPHEWISSKSGLTKVDALDHHDDHFFPGPQSAAWDLAAATVEFGMSGTRAKALLDGYARESNDTTAVRQLAFYIPVYAAFRGGYLSLAADTVADHRESRRLRATVDRYRELLAIPSAP